MNRIRLLAAILFLTACGGSEPEPTPAPIQVVPPAPEPAEPAPTEPEPEPEPAPPASVSLITPAQQRAARLLQQATFGPTLADISYAEQLTAQAWLDEQLALPASLLLPNIQNVVGKNHISHYTRFEAWLHNALRQPDQLRHRVAFALSEILVTSQNHPNLEQQPAALANYYDILLRHAFGNYRELLEEVARSPVMGVYLSHMSNEKPDPARNIRSDENFAREILQLFTIGLVDLQLDGSPVLDAKGQPVPSYDQAVIESFARVFTGWSSPGDSWNRKKKDYMNPMQAFEAYHDTDAKQLLNNVTLPAGQTAQQDLTAALDNIFAHQNVAPFISKQLIQRLVTSNPSPAYVARVAAVFNDNGSAVKGDLAAVVKAILLDTEARLSVAEQPATYGKLREPLLKTTHLWRALAAQSPTERIRTVWLEDSHGQAPQQAPSVFNFFRPNFQPAGELQQLGLNAPEAQLLTDDLLLQMQNFYHSSINQSIAEQVTRPDDFQMLLSFSALGALLTEQGLPALLDRYSLLFFAGSMPEPLRELLRKADTQLLTLTAEERCAALLYLVFISAEYAVQR